MLSDYFRRQRYVKNVRFILSYSDTYILHLEQDAPNKSKCRTDLLKYMSDHLFSYYEEISVIKDKNALRIKSELLVSDLSVDYLFNEIYQLFHHTFLEYSSAPNLAHIRKKSLNEALSKHYITQSDYDAKMREISDCDFVII